MTTLAHKLRAIARGVHLHAEYIDEDCPAYQYMQAIAPVLLALADEHEPGEMVMGIMEHITATLDGMAAERPMPPPRA